MNIRFIRTRAVALAATMLTAAPLALTPACRAEAVHAADAAGQ